MRGWEGLDSEKLIHHVVGKAVLRLGVVVVKQIVGQLEDRVGQMQGSGANRAYGAALAAAHAGAIHSGESRFLIHRNREQRATLGAFAALQACFLIVTQVVVAQMLEDVEILGLEVLRLRNSHIASQNVAAIAVA